MLVASEAQKKNKISYPLEDNGQTQSSDFLLIVWKLLTNRYRSGRAGEEFLRENDEKFSFFVVSWRDGRKS